MRWDNQTIAIRTILFNFLIVALIGLSLRWIILNPIPGLNYRFIVHTHSHMAFLGWVFGALFLVITAFYLPGSQQQFYRKLFWGFQLAVFGMLLTFPFQGYAAGSIAFSTLHTALAYLFIVKFWNSPKKTKEDPGLKYVKAGLIFFIISTIGPFVLGYASSKGQQGSNLYDLSLYFYLHFQYNGWFSFAVLGLFISWLHRIVPNVINNREKYFFWSMVAITIPLYLLSTLWTDPQPWVFSVGLISAIVQTFVVTLFIYHLFLHRFWQDQMMWWTKLLWGVATFSFLVKVVLQLGSSIPFGVGLTLLSHYLIIAYLHLVFLGFISCFLIGWFIQNNWLKPNYRMVQLGITLFVIGLISTELILTLPFYTNFGTDPFLLLLGTILLASGVILLFLSSLKDHANDSTTFSSSTSEGE